MRDEIPFEIINEILLDGKPKPAKEIAKLSREQGCVWTRKDANSNLYRMLRLALVVKIETEKIPLWTLPQFSNMLSESSKIGKAPETFFPPKDLPLSEINEFTIRIQETEIIFYNDSRMKPNDPYMQGDFLDNKIYVSLNKSHPFWQSFINNNDREYIYLTLVAEEVYVQNQVAKSTSSISVAKLLELRDKAMRDIAIKS